MLLPTAKHARIAGGGAALALAVLRLVPAKGQAFKTPGFTQADAWEFWLPAATAAAAFLPGKVPHSKRLAGLGLLAISGRRLWVGATGLTLRNGVFTYATGVTGFTLAA